MVSLLSYVAGRERTASSEKTTSIRSKTKKTKQKFTHRLHNTDGVHRPHQQFRSAPVASWRAFFFFFSRYKNCLGPLVAANLALALIPVAESARCQADITNVHVEAVVSRMLALYEKKFYVAEFLDLLQMIARDHVRNKTDWVLRPSTVSFRDCTLRFNLNADIYCMLTCVIPTTCASKGWSDRFDSLARKSAVRCTIIFMGVLGAGGYNLLHNNLYADVCALLMT